MPFWVYMHAAEDTRGYSTNRVKTLPKNTLNVLLSGRHRTLFPDRSTRLRGAKHILGPDMVQALEDIMYPN
jgi:hypothetical protein